MEILTYLINEKNIEVPIKRTTNKNMYISVKGSQVIVSAPNRVPLKTVKAFVDKNIVKFSQRAQQKTAKEFFDPSQGNIYVLGKQYKINRMTGYSRVRCELKLDTLDIKSPAGSDEQVSKAIKEFLKEITLDYIMVRQRDYETLLEIPEHKIEVGDRTSYWGINYGNKRKIIYSSSLGHYSQKIIDYVIVHELAHYKESNHSKAFWDQVRLYMPNYLEIRKRLKANSDMEEE